MDEVPSPIPPCSPVSRDAVDFQTAPAVAGPLGDHPDMPAEQLALFDNIATLPADLFFENEKIGVGEYTGERLKARRPHIYRAIITMLGSGLGIRFIERSLKVSHNTIQRVAQAEGIAIDTEKKETIGNLRQFIARGSAILAEDVEKIPIDKLPLALAVIIDKEQLLSGNATARIETGPAKTVFRTWEETMAHMKRADARTVGMGSAGEETLQGGDAPRVHVLPAARLPVDEEVRPAMELELAGEDSEAGVDMLSAVFPGEPANDTAFDTNGKRMEAGEAVPGGGGDEPEQGSEEDPKGGGGGSAFAGGSGTQINPG